MTRNGTIQFPFTKQHLANTLGMSPVHTNKTLKRLLVSKAIRWKDRVFELIDRAAFAEIAATMSPRAGRGRLSEVGGRLTCHAPRRWGIP